VGTKDRMRRRSSSLRCESRSTASWRRTLAARPEGPSPSYARFAMAPVAFCGVDGAVVRDCHLVEVNASVLALSATCDLAVRDLFAIRNPSARQPPPPILREPRPHCNSSTRCLIFYGRPDMQWSSARLSGSRSRQTP
jgi:hypothetical protein